MTKTILAAFVALAGTVGLSASAEAQTLRQAGTLTCSMGPGVGLVFGSSRGVSCTYDHYNRRGQIVRESYTGTMDRAGVDLGLTSTQTVAWRVMTPGGRSSRSMMSGGFSGSSSDASLVVGAGTQSLFGVNGRPVALSPAGNSGQVGVGLGFGATALDLRRVPNAAYSSFTY